MPSFSIRFDRALSMIQLLPSDASTREWCVLNDVDVMLEGVVRPFLDRPVADDPPLGGRSVGVVTPRMIGDVVEARLREAFPYEEIVVRSTP